MIYERQYFNEESPRIDSGNHSSDEFNRCMNEITKLLVSYNMNFEETCAVLDMIKEKLDIGQIPVKTILDYC